MNIKTGKITGKKWLVNRKGGRITKKYMEITQQTIGPFIVINGKNRKTREGLLILGKSDYIILEIRGNIDDAMELTNNLYAFKCDGRYHIYNSDGELLRDNITELWNCKRYSILSVQIDDKTYYMDYNLKILSVPFEQATTFNNQGYAIVKLLETQKLAVINKDLEFVLAPVEYDGILFCSEGYFRIIKGRKYGVVDETGKEIIPPIYDDIQYVRGYFKLWLNGKCGLADLKGNIIYECIYKYIIEKKDTDSTQQQDTNKLPIS